MVLDITERLQGDLWNAHALVANNNMTVITEPSKLKSH